MLIFPSAQGEQGRKSQHSQTIYQRSFSAVPEKVSIFTE
jgi:hypothetical protein